MPSALEIKKSARGYCHLFVRHHLIHPTPGIEPGGWIEVCDQ